MFDSIIKDPVVLNHCHSSATTRQKRKYKLGFQVQLDEAFSVAKPDSWLGKLNQMLLLVKLFKVVLLFKNKFNLPNLTKNHQPKQTNELATVAQQVAQLAST